jgi:hypothetical protein
MVDISGGGAQHWVAQQPPAGQAPRHLLYNISMMIARILAHHVTIDPELVTKLHAASLVGFIKDNFLSTGGYFAPLSEILNRMTSRIPGPNIFGIPIQFPLLECVFGHIARNVLQKMLRRYLIVRLQLQMLLYL